MKPVHWFIAGCIAVGLIACSFLIGRATAPLPEAETVRDTITKIVPVWKDFPQPVKTVSAGFVAIPAYRFLTDTVVNNVDHYIPIVLPDSTGTVFLQREQKFYSEDDGRLRLWVSGVDPSLDRYELDHIETTVTETIHPAPKRWGLSVTLGVGVSYVGGEIKAGPAVTVGISRSFVQW